MYIVSCIDKYTSLATRLSATDCIETAKGRGKQARKVYRHVTVHCTETGKIHFQRKDRDCCKLERVVYN